MTHKARWITGEEYNAPSNGTLTPEQIRAGVSASQSTSGQVLESKAGPQTLEQKDFQGNAIIHDVMTKAGLNEIESSNKTTTYGAVNSTLTEKAPNISKTYQQNQSYSETYETKTENINAETYTRDIQSQQYSKTQKNLNLNVPHNLSITANQSMTRNINTRSATIGTHTMSGSQYTMNAGTIQRFGDMTVMKGDYVSLRANKFMLNAGPDPAPQPVLPRRAKPYYNFHIVNTNGIYYQLTNSFNFPEMMGDFDISDFFEDEYWVPGEPGYKDLSTKQRRQLGRLGIGLAAVKYSNTLATKHQLIQYLESTINNIPLPPEGQGTLLQANYQICSGAENTETANLNNVFAIGSGPDYNALIKKAMTGPFVIAAPLNTSCHWEYLFIWVTKN